MLKHVQLSPYRTRSADTVSLNSRSMESMRTHLQGSMRSRQDSTEKRDRCLDSVSLASATSLSPEPLSSLLSSRSSSYCSLSDASVLQSPTISVNFIPSFK
ncbi:hypothetical protein Phum_PHUM507470 [Pediculus humanus corporis]|uniref:Uncharacterized protein n=1 Tax=Pediculus humanus subsp. corporis TaxID=121224 RepID=E0VY27_PEDHC|nr:uncharacterized protein Phum_PHUM507470 [Pediculus humanus corporis]EEB18283.1 hypothetical protein Phum_PHUM507470 [Pediculus humanus corporis]